VNTDTGNYAGSSSVFYGEGYDIAANGTYKAHFRGMANYHAVDERTDGTWELTPKRFILVRNGFATKFQLLSFTKAMDGSMEIKLLNEAYPPTRGNISLYATYWRRTVEDLKKKPK
jgi:hypothetical protein